MVPTSHGWWATTNEFAFVAMKAEGSGAARSSVDSSVATISAEAAGARERSRFRPELQALRALAVAIVVIYHVRPDRLPGGYVGVDVFFVISGFLITAHLLGEAVASGTVSLTRFWSRRIRRLLPASFVVLVFSLIATLAWIPDSVIEHNLRDIAASAVYSVNWALAADATDYLAAQALPSVVQHYWSLSVEEQFYIVWPLLLLASAAVAAAVVRRRGGDRAVVVSRVFAPVLIAIVVGSLAASVVLTSLEQPLAYFSTFARAWEFATGALLAVAVARWPSLGVAGTRLGDRLGSVAVVFGVGLIVVSSLTFDAQTDFPGWIAIVPVVGTALVIAGGGVLRPDALALRIAAVAPIQRIGDWSYAIYLWHWPMIVLYPFVFSQPLAGWPVVAIVMISIALGALTKYLVEDPVRRGSWWSNRRWPAFALAVVGAVALVGATSIFTQAIHTRTAQAQEYAATQLANAAPCFGASALDADTVCESPFDRGSRIDFAFAASDLDEDWCLAEPDGTLRTCEYGRTAAPSTVIALVGDSHAAALVPAFDQMAKDRGWKIITFLRSGCPALSGEPIVLPERTVTEQRACADWSREVLDLIESSDEVDAVVFTNFSSRYADAAVPESDRLSAQTVSETFQRMMSSGKQVTVVRDVPDTHRTNFPSCIETSDSDSAPCSFARSGALVDDVVQDAVALSPGVGFVDLSRYFCDESTCYGVIGDVVVFADENHVSGTFARTLAPYLGRELERVLE